MRRAASLLLSLVALSGCAYGYAPALARRDYSYVPLSYIAARNLTPFQAAVAACVKAYDPDRLTELDIPGGYRLSGWFLSGRRSEVAACLRLNGWPVRPVYFVM